MAENTNIEWCDHTFNPWRGCAKVHEGCAHCYAEVNYSVKMHGIKWGPHGTRVVLSDAGWRSPEKWNRDAAAAGVRRRVFCASLADVFEAWDGPILDSHGDQLFVDGDGYFSPGKDSIAMSPPATMDMIRRDLFNLTPRTPYLDWLLLTKRPENVLRMLPDWPDEPWNCGNVWIGTSISNQRTADKQIPELIKCRDLFPVLFISAEPLLGPIDLTPWLPDLDWVIVGGESGPKARQCDIAWVRDLLRQCRESGTACFVKQLGSRSVIDWSVWEEGLPTTSVPHRDTKGGDPSEWPEDLRVRQFPQGLFHHGGDEEES